MFVVSWKKFGRQEPIARICGALHEDRAVTGTTEAPLSVGNWPRLALAVFIPMSGWLADRFGARPVFASAIGLFTASSVLCGLSNGLWEFTAARILQGLGGAMMVPVGRLVVLRATAKQDLLRSIAYITWPGLAAPILGPDR